MKVYMVLNDAQLMEEVSRMKDVTGVFTVSHYRDIEQEHLGDNVLIMLSDHITDVHEIPEIRDHMHTDVKIIYLISNSGDISKIKQAEVVCHNYGIDFVPPYRTVNQIIQIIESKYFYKPEKENRVVSFISSLPQQGLTTSILSIADIMSQRSDSKIGILSLNGFNPGDSFFNYQGSYFDQLWSMLHTKQLTTDELFKKMYRISPSCYYLAGSKDLKKLYYYDPEGVDYLIQTAKKSFDLILLDCGSYPDNALSGQGILVSDLICLNITQTVSSKEGWERQFDYIINPILNVSLSKFMLMVNKEVGIPEYDTPRQLSGLLKIPLLGALPYQESLARDYIKNHPLSKVDEVYLDRVERIAKTLCHTFQLPYREPVYQDVSKKKTGFLSKIFASR